MEPDSQIALLKEIIDNLAKPENLDNHPWINKRFVFEAEKQRRTARDLPPGKKLVEAVVWIFEKLQPAMPPRRGLRLDTRWGEFGLLAALYFAPYKFGTPNPVTFREAWQGIDRAILLFVFGPDKSVTLEEKQRYQLIGGEKEIAANSTISDWHRKGLEHLAGVLLHYENSLDSRSNDLEPAHMTAENWKKSKFSRLLPTITRVFAWSCFIFFIGFTAWFGFLCWQVNQRITTIRDNSQVLLYIKDTLSEPGKLEEAGHSITLLKQNLQAIQKEDELFINISPYFGWIPQYGGDISQISKLLEMGIQLTSAGDEVFQVVSPALSVTNGTVEVQDIPGLMTNLNQGNSRLVTAQASLATARAIRQMIDIDRLSPKVRSLLVDKIDPIFLSMQNAFPVDDILEMARLSPRILGSVGNGPQSYLVMVQNEDELRATGGFLSAVGVMVFDNGKLTNLSFDSYELFDDFSKPYPKAPWQLDEYMMAEMLLLRDANWFTNFPTSVSWVRFLYGYTRPGPVQGVIAIDQNAIVELLRQVGPITVDGESEMITADNVIQFMRSSKEQTPPAGVSPESWNRKRFINRIADPLSKKLMAGDAQSWQTLSRTIIQLLNEKHILLNFDDPEMKELVARSNWDGAVRPITGSDFLMSVDSNIGFNKTYAVMQVAQEYDVDLSDMEKPKAQFTIHQENRSSINLDCIQSPGGTKETLAEKDYRINGCFWSYLRIYTPAGSEMISSTPHAIMAPWPLRNKDIPARTDTLNEDIPGVQPYGTLLVVPTGQSLDTSFFYSLPSGIITQKNENQSWVYRLKVQKQPGTKAIPIDIRFHLPSGMKVKNPMDGLHEDSGSWLLRTDLRQDREIEVEISATN
jgi:hypothetical protein